MKLALLAGFLMAVGVAGILVTLIIHVHGYDNPADHIEYGVVLDAGSSATRAYIFEWHHRVSSKTPYISIVKKDDKPRIKEITPGITSLAPNFTDVGEYLDPLIDWAHDKVPDGARSSTPIFLLGTGGVRLLPAYESDMLITCAKNKLQDTGFLYEEQYVGMLVGAEEAAYGFLAVNELYNHFDEGNPGTTFGSLDLGGVSSEISFLPTHKAPVNYTFPLTINGTYYEIYVQSNDGLGVNVARNLHFNKLAENITGYIVNDPCLPYGYMENITLTINSIPQVYTFSGSSNTALCQAQVEALVKELTAGYPKPPITGTFVTSDKYLKIKDFFKLKDNANIVELNTKVNSFCALDYSIAIDHHKKYADTVQDYCFMGLYASYILTDYYGFDTSLRHIIWKDSVDNAPITWALGAMVDHVAAIPPDPNPNPTYPKVRFYHTDGGIAVLFIAALCFVLGLVLFILQRRRPSGYVPVN